MTDRNRRTIPGSFRDPSGFMFDSDGALYRQVNISYKDDYDALIASGLFKELADAGLIISHNEVDVASPDAQDRRYKTLKPEPIPFVSYPYEWCFSQLKNAALALLDIQSKALDRGMSLKDASAYNIQFLRNRPVLIDTLSFERYREGSPWVAYGQFCRHFLAPLALISCKDARLNQLSRIFIDGIPLDLASSLLPASTRFNFPILTHIHLHAGYQSRFDSKTVSAAGRVMSKTAIMGLIDNLGSAVSSLAWRAHTSEWSGYYTDTAYSAVAFMEKERIVSEFLGQSGAATAWDLGANTGFFSRIAASKGIETVSFDADMACVEANYLGCLKEGKSGILPLVMDLANPSPGIGWENSERSSLIDRGGADAALALALIHHLAIANNLPLDRIAGFFAAISRKLIIEFAPKTDPQVKKMLSSRQDIFPAYSRQGFEDAFSKFFTVNMSAGIKETDRTLYLMTKK